MALPSFVLTVLAIRRRLSLTEQRSANRRPVRVINVPCGDGFLFQAITFSRNRSGRASCPGDTSGRARRHAHETDVMQKAQ
jgi:hypothetical protein